MRRKIVVTVSAMMIAAKLGNPLLAAVPSTEQLGVIAGYLDSNDVQGLRDYLAQYPDLTMGDTTLAVLLRQFMQESADVRTYLGFRPDLSETFQGVQDDQEDGGSSPVAAPDSVY